MNNFARRLVALTAALTISVSATAFADTDTDIAAAETEVELSFTDMPNDWRTTAIVNAVKNGLISGMGDGTVAPDANITRAQMAAIIVRALGATEEADLSKFNDVSADKWYYTELSKAVYMQAFSGDDNNMMNPESNITFQECFTVLSRVFGLDIRNTEASVESLAAYTDGAEVADWAKIYYGSMVSNGYWTGGEKKLLTPKAYITRGEFAVVMDNLVKTYISESGEVGELPAGNVVVRGSGVVLDGKVIEGDLIVGDGVEAGKISLNDINITGRLVFRGCAAPGLVEYELEDGTIGEKLSYTINGCSPTGSAFDIQLIAPYISVSVGGMEYKALHCAKNSRIYLGDIG